MVLNIDAYFYENEMGEQFNLLTSIFYFIRNSSNHVIADLSITFGQDVSMSHFSVLYNALYIEGRIGDVQVRPLNDTRMLLSGLESFLTYKMTKA
jgi:hypothetical protein